MSEAVVDKFVNDFKKDVEKYRRTQRTDSSDLRYCISKINLFKKLPGEIKEKAAGKLLYYANNNKMNEWFQGLYDIILHQYQQSQRAGRSVR